MHIGFTGTRKGMTVPQIVVISQLLYPIGWIDITVHHGDCVGADARMHVIAKTLGLDVVIHPPDKDDMRAFCESPNQREPLPYLERDRNIVDASEMLIATPKGPPEKGSGTWYTTKYALDKGKDVHIVMPSGRVHKEWS